KSKELPIAINEDLFNSYYLRYKSLAEQVGSETADLFKLALQSPNVSSPQAGEENEVGDWGTVRQALLEAIESCNKFRSDEGKTLQQSFVESIGILEEALEQVKLEEPRRRKKIQERIKGNFSEWLEENSFDQNRFEQELIYYLEKLDITEEMVRLYTHLEYFKQNLSDGKSQGKKLGFISQELGREINTIG